MPSGMRKSTRVFGGTRVLRSGRRLSTEPREGSKYSKVTRGENDWIGLVDKSDEGGGNAASNSIDRKYVKRKVGKVGSGTLKAVNAEPMIDESVSGGVIEIKDGNMMFGAVYKRKRKRAELADDGNSEDKMFGKKYARKQRGRKLRESEQLEVREDVSSTINRCPVLAILARDVSCSSCYWMTRFLTSVLGYMMKIRLGIRQLSAFVLSKPIFDAYYSHGLLFLQGSNNINTPGVCMISGSKSLIPIFSVDFSAIPFCFVHMHTSMYIRSLYFFCFVAHAPGIKDSDGEIMDLAVEMTDVVDVTMETSCQIAVDGYHSDVVVMLPTFPAGDKPGDDMIGTAKSKSKGKELALPVTGLRKYSLRSSLQFRNNGNIQKRRTSLMLKRGRPTPVFRAQKDSGALSADFLRIRNVSSHITSAASTRTLRSLVNRGTNAVSPKALKSNLGVLKQGLLTNSCTTNVLIIQSDRCYREEGATIALEQSETKQWFLAVKINGINRYTLNAHKVMRPPGSNRFSHATVWSGDGSWKLEFPDKEDWLVFKELYKECSNRNIQAPATSMIPIPRVQEVLLYDNGNNVPYARPSSYITVKDDELTRALGKTVANYDMDSEDEEWLNKFNEDLQIAGGHLQQLTHERFELIIDAFERSMHCPGDEYSNEQAAEDIFMPIEAVHSYWMKKRKHNHSSALRIFQLYQPKRNPVISKPILRKKRSFKRQPSQGGRGEQRNILQAIVEEQNGHAQPNYVQNSEEAKAVADRSEELAVLKRLRAQKLMENADLATYKAVIALRIAEAAQVTDSPSTVAPFFLG